MKLKGQLARDEVQIPADLRRQRRRQQSMDHQAALFVQFEVMLAFVTGQSRKKPDVFFGKSSFPDKYIANVHMFEA